MNTAGEEQSFQFGAVVPFEDAWGEHAGSEAKLALFPENRLEDSDAELGVTDESGDGSFEPVPSDPKDGCWQAPDEFHYAGEPLRLALDPCEHVSRTYLTFAHPQNSPCFPAGDYRFETSVERMNGEESFTWGFEIQMGR